MLNVSERHPSDIRASTEVFTEAKQKGLAGIAARVVSEETISVDGGAGMQLEFQSLKYHGRIRYILIGRRFYQLMSVAPAQKEIPPETGRFFDSFRQIQSH
jgi:hypothetical protein